MMLNTFQFSLLAAENSLTLHEITHLKNPYLEQINNNDNLIEGSPEAMELHGRDDRFSLCQSSGMTVFIAFARGIAVLADNDVTETKSEAMKRMAGNVNLTYPFDKQEVAESSNARVDKLAIELGWLHPGMTDSHYDRIAPIYWKQCLQLPLDSFAAEWAPDTTVYDSEGYDDEGYDSEGRTREENAKW